MDIWEELTKAVESEEVRVEQRLALIELMCLPKGAEKLQERLEKAQEQLNAACRQLRKEALGR